MLDAGSRVTLCHATKCRLKLADVLEYTWLINSHPEWQHHFTLGDKDTNRIAFEMAERVDQYYEVWASLYPTCQEQPGCTIQYQPFPLRCRVEQQNGPRVNGCALLAQVPVKPGIAFSAVAKHLKPGFLAVVGDCQAPIALLHLQHPSPASFVSLSWEPLQAAGGHAPRAHRHPSAGFPDVFPNLVMQRGIEPDGMAFAYAGIAHFDDSGRPLFLHRAAYAKLDVDLGTMWPFDYLSTPFPSFHCQRAMNRDGAATDLVGALQLATTNVQWTRKGTMRVLPANVSADGRERFDDAELASAGECTSGIPIAAMQRFPTAAAVVSKTFPAYTLFQTAAGSPPPTLLD